jgi:phage-related baseplate assembly protein
MSRYDSIDLSLIAPPDVVETLDSEALITALKSAMVAAWPNWTADLESDPVNKILEVIAYREILLRQRVNDAARSVLLATASGADLDNLAALFHVGRQVLIPADDSTSPPTPAVYEDDERLRARVQLALEGLSTAGPEGAYVFHALSADGRVLDVAVGSPSPGEVVVTILSNQDDGVPTSDLIAAVEAALNDQDVRPLTDHVTVQAASRTDYQVAASLEVYHGPDLETVRQSALERVSAFCADQQRLGEPVTLDGLYCALRADGVRKVTLQTPLAAIEPTTSGYAYCTAISVTATQVEAP